MWGWILPFPKAPWRISRPAPLSILPPPLGLFCRAGRDINNTSLQAVKVVLHHGGMLGVGNARAVLQDGFASGTGQELFDIELRAEAGVFAVHVSPITTTIAVRSLPANAILQPYTDVS